MLMYLKVTGKVRRGDVPLRGTLPRTRKNLSLRKFPAFAQHAHGGYDTDCVRDGSDVWPLKMMARHDHTDCILDVEEPVLNSVKSKDVKSPVQECYLVQDLS